MQNIEGRSAHRTHTALVIVAMIVAVYLLVVFVAPPPAFAIAQQDGQAELYTQFCGACHQPNGQGVAGTFPPLAGNEAASNREYVLEVIREGRSGPLVVLGEDYDQPMPPVAGMSDDEMATVADYVVGLATGDVAADAGPATELGEGDADRGHDLFNGSSRFDAGGAACSSCHVAGDIGNLGGRSLGPDLTDVHERLGGDVGLSAWLANPPSATMMPIFGDRPLNDSEVAHVVAFLELAPELDEPVGSIDWFTLLGVGVLVALLSAMTVVWQGMRQTYSQKLKPRSNR